MSESRTPGRRPAARRTRVVAVSLAAALVGFGLGAGRLIAEQHGRTGSWAQGPVRWLLLPRERKQFRRLSSNPERIAFIEEFWRRRDPTPREPGNPFAQLFFERVAAADRLYGEGETPGSLTARGRALILLGSPTFLRHSQRTVPVLTPSTRARGREDRTARRRVAVEIWGYRMENLPPRFQETLKRHPPNGEIRLSFVVDGDQTYLEQGEIYLEQAARAAVQPRFR